MFIIVAVIFPGGACEAIQTEPGAHAKRVLLHCQQHRSSHQTPL